MNIEFNQANRVKGLIFTIVYLTVVFGILLSFFSLFEIIAYLENRGSNAIIFIGALVIIFSVLFLIRFATDRGSFVLKNGKIYIEINRKKSQIDIQQVGMLIFNDGPRKTLTIYSKSGQIFVTLCPVIGKSVPEKMLLEIINEISKHIEFKTSSRKEKTLGQEYLVTIYNR